MKFVSLMSKMQLFFFLQNVQVSSFVQGKCLHISSLQFRHRYVTSVYSVRDSAESLSATKCNALVMVSYAREISLLKYFVMRQLLTQNMSFEKKYHWACTQLEGRSG